MKFKRSFLLLMAICLALSGCTQTNYRTEKKTKIKVGIAVYKQEDIFVSNLVTNFQELAKKKESELNITISIDIVDSKSNQGLQNDQVDKFLMRGYDVICVNMVDRTAAAVIIDKAKAADIPVIFFNREPVEEDLSRWDKLFYVGAMANDSGGIQGEIVVDYYLKHPKELDRNNDEKIQYVMIEGEPGHQDALLRTEYSVKTVAESGIKLEKLDTYAANWQKAPANSIMLEWIQQFGSDIEVVFCNNDDMALGAINALADANTDWYPLIVGVDGIPTALAEIKEGRMYGTAMQNIMGQAESILNLSYALACGLNVNEEVKNLDGKYVRYSYTMVTQENILEYLK